MTHLGYFMFRLSNLGSCISAGVSFIRSRWEVDGLGVDPSFNNDAEGGGEPCNCCGGVVWDWGVILPSPVGRTLMLAQRLSFSHMICGSGT